MSGERTFYDFGYGASYHADVAWASAQWYVTSQVRIGVRVELEAAEDAYAAEVEFQPRFLGDMVGIYADYMRSDSDYYETNGIRLGFNFYFNKRFDLITRDGQYR